MKKKNLIVTEMFSLNLKLIISFLLISYNFNGYAQSSNFEWKISTDKIYPTVIGCRDKTSKQSAYLDTCINQLGVKYLWVNKETSKCSMFTLKDQFIKFSQSSNCSSCNAPTASEPALIKLIAQIEALNTHLDVSESDKRIELYANKVEPGYKVAKILKTPTHTTSTSADYKHLYQKLMPNECLYLEVPKELRSKPILFVNLGHSQQYQDNTGYDPKTKWDKNPALTTIQVNPNNNKGETKWRYWGGMSSGDLGAKFAEPGGIELEGLYEWYKNGHRDIKEHQVSYEPLYTDAVRLCSIGKDPVTINSFTLKVAPQKSDSYEEFKISQSHNMGDPLTAKGRNYGSPQDALVINDDFLKQKQSTLENGLVVGADSIEVPIKPGKSLNSFEISIGDQFNGQDPGWARLNVKIIKKNGQSINIIKDENVPPTGVLVGSPEENYVIQEGDRLVVSVSDFKAFIMGMRVGFLTH